MTPHVFVYISRKIIQPFLCNIVSAVAVTGPFAASIINGAFTFTALLTLVTPARVAGIRVSQSVSKRAAPFCKCLAPESP